MASIPFQITLTIGDESVTLVDGAAEMSREYGSVGVDSVTDPKGYPLPDLANLFSLKALAGPALAAARDAYDAANGDGEDRLAAAELWGRNWL